MKKLPPWTYRFVFAALLSGMMSFLVSGVATLKAIGLDDAFFTVWMEAWALAWPVACAVALLVVPLVRRATAWLVAQDRT